MSAFSRIVGLAAGALLVAAPADQATGQGRRIAEEEVGLPPIGVFVPAGLAGLDESQRDALEGQLTEMVTRNGLSGIAYGARFLLVPTLTVLAERKVEAMQTLVVVRARLTLSVKQRSGGIAFSSMSRDLTGTGRDRGEALTDLVTSGIGGGDDETDALFRTTRTRIVDYYERSCDGIVAEVQRLFSARQYADAFALAMSVPREARSCAPRLEPHLDRAFAAYERDLCTREVTHAAALAAAGDVISAAEHVTAMESTTPCQKGVDDLIETLRKRLGALDSANIRYAFEVARSNARAREAARSETRAASKGGARNDSAASPSDDVESLKEQVKHLGDELTKVAAGGRAQVRDEGNDPRIRYTPRYIDIVGPYKISAGSGKPVSTDPAPTKPRGGADTSAH